MKARERVVALGALVVSCAVLPGCLVSSSSHSRQSGQFVGSTTFNQVEPGVTTEEWVLATFGAPTSRTTMSDGSEILKWAYTQTRNGRGSVFLLFGGSSSSERQGASFVQLQNGVVVKAWRD